MSLTIDTIWTFATYLIITYLIENERKDFQKIKKKKKLVKLLDKYIIFARVME